MSGGEPRRRLLAIGLDSAPPEFLFGRCLPGMPNMRRLVERGVRGVLRTTDPPISIPAWAVMFTGVDPGTLGFYGFRHRLHHSYTQNYAPSSTLLPVPSLWKILSDRGRRVCVVGMPPGYPPPPVNGVYISDFLTPGDAVETTHPPELARELAERYGPYRFDVTFRATERQQLYRDIVAMTQQHFAVAEELYGRERWDVFAIHEVGTDRLHHAFTKYFDPSHQDFQAGNPFEHVVEEYYRIVDQSLGRLLSLVDDDTIVFVGSDHGSMPMAGCFCINQWLIDKGYLALRHPVPPGTPLEKAPVDWSRTAVWGAGGYYARLFFNIRGREPEGSVDPADVPAVRERLLRDLAQLPGADGRPLAVEVLDPQRIYREVRGDPPDLMAYFGHLRWRSAGSLGHPSLYLRENDTGPDDAVHSFEGIFLVYDPRVPDGREIAQQSVLDVTPTLLDLLGEPIPAHIQGRVMPGLRRGPGTGGPDSNPAAPPPGQS